ncbi:MAG: hypothetical protein ACYTAS_09230, partial [Planctomycetota bacterium]|jgi:hypothetical protein
VKGQLGEVLGNPQPAGLSTSGTFTVFSPMPGGPGPDPTRIGLLIPVSDYQQFVSDNPNVSDPDGNGISQIGPAGSPMIAVTQVGDFALASRAGNEQALVEAKKALAGNTSGLAASLDAAERQRAATAPVWAYANVQMAGQMFGPLVQGKLQEAKQAIEAVQAQTEGQAPGSMAQAAAAMDMYASILDTLMKEARFVSLSLQPSPGKVSLALTMAAAPGTGMAEMLQGSATKQTNKLVGYMANGAAVNFAGSMEAPFWEKLNMAYMEMLPKLMGTDANEEAASQLKQMMADISDVYGGFLAGSFKVNPQSKPPFEVSYVADLKDAQKFYQVMDQVSKMLTEGPIAELYASMGMKMSFDLKRNAETYNGVAIDAVKFNLEPTNPDAPEAQIIAAMYGGGLNISLAVANDHLIYVLAQDPGPAIKKLIDRVKAGGPQQTPTEVQAAMSLIPGADKADFFLTINVLRFFQMIGSIVPIPIPQVQINTQSNLAMVGNVGNGKMTMELAVPKQHVQEIMGVVMQVQQQMQPQTEPQTQPQTQP